MRRQGSFDPSRWRTDAQALLDQWRRTLGASEPFGVEQFELWYRRHMPVPRDYLEVSADDSAPHGGADANHAQRVSAAVNRIRDQHVVSQVQTAWRQHRHVLLVMGSSHLLTQLPALQSMLGEPRYSKPF